MCFIMENGERKEKKKRTMLSGEKKSNGLEGKSNMRKTRKRNEIKKKVGVITEKNLEHTYITFP